MIDYNALRAQTLGSAQEEEAVTVNTRALIDKVLARYSSENTTLRELLQNAADASATSVEVRYDSVNKSPQPSYQETDIQDLVRQKMRRVLVKNNGHPFREEDWQRLKRIAEGNPDETKIGAFGVGFYSVFADCEEPFVSSGNETMVFYWKENTLVTRRHKLKTSDPFTTFLLEYREPTELPDLKELCKFFATSLTFVKLSSISLYVDDRCLLRLGKKASPSEPLAIPSSINPVTSQRLMQIRGVETERLQIDAKYMNITHHRAPIVDIANGLRSIFSRFGTAQPTSSTTKEISPSNPSEYSTATIFLRIATATVTTSVSSAFAKELERATKKPPPKTTKIAILSMSKDELDASEHNAQIFSNVLPSKAGKIFIGFPTHQTTSISAHISAPSVIPTVERENIDLNARVVKEWNIEMLRISGILARIMYTDEMVMLGQRAAGLKAEDLTNLFDHAIHIMQQFTFAQSTPSPAVGRYIESEFWGCSREGSIELLSTRGVLLSDRVRVASDVNFLEGMPLLPEKLEKEAPIFVTQLKEMGLLTEITISDIRRELGNKALSGEQLGLFLKWLAGKRLKNGLDTVGVKNLLEVAVAMTAVADSKGEGFGIPISLGTVRFYINAQRLAADIPVPHDCLPFNVTKNLTKQQLDALGWEELGVLYWLQYICTKASVLPVEQNIQLSAKFAHHVLAIISKSWEQLPVGNRDAIITLLKDKACVPTRQGMKVPREAYFNTVKLFSDLPLVESMHGVRDKFLTALGVRKTVELKLVFERLMSGSQAGGALKWSHVDLIRYLTSVRDDIPKEDITKLKSTTICKAEAVDATTLYKVSDLYEPNDSLRKLKLPILQWPGILRETSNEAKFLASLGLRKYPGVQEVLQIAANRENVVLREAALSYFMINYHTNSYNTFNTAGVTIPFLPLDGGGRGEKGLRLVAPYQCFSNPKATIMGFDVLRQDLQQHGPKLGVKPDPDMKDCVDKLINSPPITARAAREQFGYFSTRLADIMPHLVERLSQARIIPVSLKGHERIQHPGTKYKHITPGTCFLGGAGSQYFDIFDFVDFGQEANAFLLKCGSKHEPTVGEVAYMMVREPQRLYRVFNSSEKYLSVLRSIADNWARLGKDKVLLGEMRKSPFLGSFRWRSYTNEKAGQLDAMTMDEDDAGGIREFVLARVDEVLVSDDYVMFLLFRGEILAAPQEDALESFYQSLGVQRLSSKVSTDWRIGHVKSMPEITEKLRKLVLERSRLFLHNNTEEVLHDARWLENNLMVKMVDSIRLRRTLRNEGSKQLTHQDTKTAAVTLDTKTRWWILFLTPKYEFYDVSQALVHLILRKPRPHSSLLLDSLLHNDLMTLKSRGYNVDRILRAKAAEARLAEEQRLKQAEVETKALEEQEKRYQQSQLQLQQTAVTRQAEQKMEEEKPAIPGTFKESPQSKALAPPIPQQIPDRFRNNFLGRISRHLGFERDNEQAEQIQNLLDSNNTQQQWSRSPLQIEPGPSLGSSKPDVEKATEPHRIQANLKRAIGASRGHDSDSVFSPPQTFEVKEAPSYCDNHSGQDILHFADTSNGIKVFIDRKIEDRAAVGEKYAKNMSEFSNILKELSGIFGLAITTLHIFYDEIGNTIAFNTNGSLFCNLRFYLQLHAKDVTNGDLSQALIYWFVVLCHELAHNLVQVHDEKHSFYTETFVQEYFVKVMTNLKSNSGTKPWDINI